MEQLLELLFVIGLIAINGFFVASEYALISIRKTRVDELARKKNTAARLVQKALADVDTYISATQLGVTLASLALGWIGEPTIAHFLIPVFSFLPDNVAWITANGVAIFLAFFLITFAHIVLGELVPKTVALQKTEHTVFSLIFPLTVFILVFKPVIIFLRVAGGIVIQLFGLQTKTRRHQLHSEEEVKLILAQSGQSGMIPQDEIEMVYNVFKLGDIPIKNIMVPRGEIVGFTKNTKASEIRKKVEQYFFSRYPIYEGTIDTIIGFIHIKDITKFLLENPPDHHLTKAKIIRTTLSIPETKKADEVLLEMQKKRIHIAVIRNGRGRVRGIVTLEDILESLVGEIEDEFDKAKKGLYPVSNKRKEIRKK